MESKKLKFGEIENISPGDIFESRKELNAAGVHGPTMAGIWGRENEGACSIVLSGGYEDDIDDFDYIKYTGHGGQDSPGGKQVADQVFKRGNLALKISCDNGYPVRVTRGFQVPHGPESGYRYDGLYCITSYERIKGKRGFFVCRFDLKRHQYPQMTAPVKKIIKTSKKRPFKNLHVEELEKKSDSKEFEVEILNELNYRNTVRSNRLKSKLKLRKSFLKGLEEKEEPIDNLKIDQESLDLKISELALSPRTFNALSSENINTVSELIQYSEYRLLRIPNLGKKSLNEIKEVLETLSKGNSMLEVISPAQRKFLDKGRNKEVLDQWNNTTKSYAEIAKPYNLSRELIRQDIEKARRLNIPVLSVKEKRQLRNSKKEKEDKRLLLEDIKNFKTKIIDLYRKGSNIEISKKLNISEVRVANVIKYLVSSGELDKKLSNSKKYLGTYEAPFEIKIRREQILVLKGRRYTTDQIAEELGVSRVTVTNDVRALKAGGIEVPFSRVSGNSLTQEEIDLRTSFIREKVNQGWTLDRIATNLGLRNHSSVLRHINLYMSDE